MRPAWCMRMCALRACFVSNMHTHTCHAIPFHSIPFHSPPLLPGQAEPSLFSPAKIVGRTAGAGLCSCLCWSAGRLTKRSDHSSTRARAQCNYAYTSIHPTHPTHRRRSLSFCSLSLLTTSCRCIEREKNPEFAASNWTPLLPNPKHLVHSAC